MGRYNTTTAIRNKFGKQIAKTTIISMPFDANDIYIKTTSIERLDLLANEFYGDASDWYKIASANNLGKGSLWVPANTILRIPKISKLDDYITKLNNER